MNQKQKGLIHIPLVLVLIFVVTLGTVVIVGQNNNQDVKGTLIAKDDSGDSDKSSDSGSSRSGSGGSSDKNDDDSEDRSGSTSGSSGTSSISGSGETGSTPRSESKTKTITPGGVRIETKTKDDKQKTEVRFGEGEKIKTRVEEGRTRIDVISGGVKVRYEIRDGRVIIKAETEEGEDVEDEEIVKIVDRLDKTGIKVATAGGRLVVARNQIGAASNFPLQIDLATNQLIASTSAGTRVLTVLPDQAVQNMLVANVISRLGPPAIRQAVESGEATSAAQIIQLGLRAGVPVYEIPGIRDFRLLGFIPVSAPVTAVVSAETGELVTTDQPLLTRVIDLLSP